MTPQETARLLVVVNNLWPRQPITVTETTVRVWSALLADVDYRDAQMWVTGYSVQSEWPPRPAQVAAESAGWVQVPGFDDVWRECLRFLSGSGLPGRPDLPLPEDESLAARVYREAGGYQAINDARYGIVEARRTYQQLAVEERYRLAVEAIAAPTTDRQQLTEGTHDE